MLFYRLAVSSIIVFFSVVPKSSRYVVMFVPMSARLPSLKNDMVQALVWLDSME